MKWTIDKEFAACFGHRVHNQNLDTRFTENNDGCLACRHLHGHQMIIKVFLESHDISANDMVTDFKHLGWFKNFIDDVIDHKFMLDINDPLLPEEASFLMDDNQKLDYSLLHEMPEGYWIPNLTKIRATLDDFIKNFDFDKAQAQAIFEKYEGLVLVDFVPTSERLTEWLYDIVAEKMKDLPVKVQAVEYWETPKSHSRYEG